MAETTSPEAAKAASEVLRDPNASPAAKKAAASALTQVENNPEVNSDFARSKRLAKERGTAPGVDPETGERAAVTYRQLFNENGGDAAKAEADFRAIARAGGYGDVELNQALDIRSLSRSVEENKRRADQADDLYARRQHEQQAQHQDNLVNAVGEALERIKRG
jgi:hypothetical protein